MKPKSVDGAGYITCIRKYQRTYTYTCVRTCMHAYIHTHTHTDAYAHLHTLPGLMQFKVTQVRNKFWKVKTQLSYGVLTYQNVFLTCTILNTTVMTNLKIKLRSLKRWRMKCIIEMCFELFSCWTITQWDGYAAADRVPVMLEFGF